MRFHALSSFLLLLAAAVAPWLAGANTTLMVEGWWLGLPLAGSFVLRLADHANARAALSARWPALVSASVLCVCLLGWMISPAPAFATTFAEEHWYFLEEKFPFVMLHWPRSGQLAFLGAAVMGFVVAADLGQDETFRRRLTATIGTTGLVIALYALGIKWLGWSKPAWIQLEQAAEQFNVCFFHHNAPGAAFNLAWPLLIFPPRPTSTTSKRMLLSAASLLAAGALLLWHSLSAPVIAAGLLALGVFWRGITGTVSPRAWSWTVRGTIAAAFAGILAWQIWSVAKSNTDFPDNWISAADTLESAAVRDIAFQTAANRRGDRLVASPAPPRQSAWLAGARMAADYPLIGLGPGAWVTHAVLYSNDPLVNTFHQHRQFAHHDLLQMAAEWGGLCAAAALVIWIGAYWRLSRGDPAAPIQEMGPLLSLFGIGIHSMVHFPLQNPAVLLWTVFLLGVAWSIPSPTGQRAIPPT